MTNTVAATPGRESSTGPEQKKAPRKIKFGPANEFQRELKRRVDRYFDETGLSRHGGWPMYRKTSVILLWFFVSYAVLVFAPLSIPAAILMAISLALASAAIGFNIQHDGGHRAYSKNPKINKLTAMTMDLVGASSYFWDRKHNYLHHTFSNITGHDDDIELGIFGRLSPHQRRLFFHRWQHIYLWPLYGFLTIKWHLFDDFRTYARAKINDHPITRPKGWDFVGFFGGKTLFFSLALIIPMFFHAWWVVLLFYFGVAFILGFVISVVFQLAHCVEEATFPMPDEADYRMANNWFVHQIETTADFARGSRFLTWYLGGLNFQVEHHLFPNISHIHYPAMSKIVEKACAEYNVNYRAHVTFVGSIASHYRWLREMGLPNEPVAA